MVEPVDKVVLDLQAEEAGSMLPIAGDLPNMGEFHGKANRRPSNQTARWVVAHSHIGRKTYLEASR